MHRKRSKKENINKISKERRVQIKTLSTKKYTPKGPDALSLALYLISFILIVFGSWYHKISWLLLGFVPFLVALWYEYMKHHI